MSEKKAFQAGLMMGATLGGLASAVAVTSAEIIGDVVRSNIGEEAVIHVPEDPKPEDLKPEIVLPQNFQLHEL